MRWMIKWSSISLSKVNLLLSSKSVVKQCQYILYITIYNIYNIFPSFRWIVIMDLFFLEPPVQIIGNSGHPEHHILVAGDDLILECEVSRPNATVQWLCNGKILKPDARVQIDSYDVVRKLVLSGLQPSDSGKYICDATDDKLITVVEVQGKFEIACKVELISVFDL